METNRTEPDRKSGQTPHGPARHLLQPGVTYACRMAAITCGECFVDDSCFEFFLRRLVSRAPGYRVNLHAYCLLPREVLLLATPMTPQGVSGLLQSVASCYGRYFALRFDRSRRVFSTRLHCLPLENPQSVIEIQRLMERLGINNDRRHCPGRYHWSSYSEHALGGRQTPLILHSAWRRVIPAGIPALAAYRQRLACPIPEHRYHSLRQSLCIESQQRQHPAYPEQG